MPIMPNPKVCNILGCKDKKSFGTGYCLNHGAERSDKYKTNAKLYNSTAWKQQRTVMRSIHPLCACCLIDGRVTQTDHIDHVIPHRRKFDRFMVNLFQGLCISCHTQKTALESKGIYRHYLPTGVKDYSDEDYNYLVVKNYT